MSDHPLALRIVAVIVGGAACAASTTGATRAPSAGETAAVLRVIDALNDAGTRRDVKALAALYSGSYFHANPDGSVWPRDRVIASYAGPTPQPPSNRSRVAAMSSKSSSGTLPS
jgi:hypothetical protein